MSSIAIASSPICRPARGLSGRLNLVPGKRSRGPSFARPTPRCELHLCCCRSANPRCRGQRRACLQISPSKGRPEVGQFAVAQRRPSGEGRWEPKIDLANSLAALKWRAALTDFPAMAFAPLQVRDIERWPTSARLVGSRWRSCTPQAGGAALAEHASGGLKMGRSIFQQSRPREIS